MAANQSLDLFHRVRHPRLRRYHVFTLKSVEKKEGSATVGDVMRGKAMARDMQHGFNIMKSFNGKLYHVSRSTAQA